MFKKVLNFFDDIRKYASFNFLILLSFTFPKHVEELYKPSSNLSGGGLVYWVSFFEIGLLAILLLVITLIIHFFERKFSLKIKSKIFDYLIIVLFQITGFCIFLFYFLPVVILFLFVIFHIITSPFFK